MLLLTLALTLSQNVFAVESTSDANFTSYRINSASTSVKNFVELKHRLPTYVRMDDSKVTMPQLLDLMTTNVQNINSGTTPSVSLENVECPTYNNENTKIGILQKSEYLSLAQTIQTSIASTGTAPPNVETSIGIIGFKNLVYTYSKILAFYKINNRLPNYVSVNPWPNSLGWTSLSSYTYHHQTTEYTCGPSVLKMALSSYNLTVSESWLAQAAGTNPYTGTSQSGMVAAINAVNAKYGTNFYLTTQRFTGWNVINTCLYKGIPVILRVHSWLDTYGTHYVMITGINFETGMVRLADPSYNGDGTFSIYDEGVSVHEVTIKELQDRIEWMINNEKTTNPMQVLFNR